MSDDLVHLPRIAAQEFGISTSEARRGIAIGALRISGATITDLDVPRAEVEGKMMTLGWRHDPRRIDLSREEPNA